jgi:hypothetical protein
MKRLWWAIASRTTDRYHASSDDRLIDLIIVDAAQSGLWQVVMSLWLE